MDLKSDCQKCFALCCVALPYAKSADFPLNKDGGDPCHNLNHDNRCNIHEDLRDTGFRGCVSYECFGAGQHVSQTLFYGRDWRENNEQAKEMFSVFPLVQQLHEMLWYLQQALSLQESKPFHTKLQCLFDMTVELTMKRPQEIIELDIVNHRSQVNELLVKTSEVYRSGIEKKKAKKKKLDYLGANLKGRDFKGADFRGTLLIAANLSSSDLRKADLIGADLRDANLKNANLSETLFLTQSQLNSAKGNEGTKIPDYLDKPVHW